MTTTGCFAQPDPEPAPLFSSEEEAFAAAEETYRAYVDALNQVDLSDPETFEEVYAWTTGDANAGERKSLSGMHADGWVVSGKTTVESVSPGSIDDEIDPTIVIHACINVGLVEVYDATGISQVAEDRPDTQSQTVSLTGAAESPTGLLIAEVEGGSGGC